MIKIETLSGQPYDQIYLNETDSKYFDIKKHIMKNIKIPYPEYNPSSFKYYTMYVKTDIKLFNKGQLINFNDDISFDKEDSVLQIFIKYQYLCYKFEDDSYNHINELEVYYFTEENRYEKIIDLIKIDGYFINLLRKEEQTEDICKLAIQQDNQALEVVKNQTEEICKFAIKQNGLSLEYVKNQNEEICKLAVQQNGHALQYVKNQTEKICKLAVQQNYQALKYVNEQTEEICKLAVQQNYHALKYMKEQTEEICKLAIKSNYNSLNLIKEQTEEICIYAVKQDKRAFELVKHNIFAYIFDKLQYLTIQNENYKNLIDILNKKIENLEKNKK